MSPPEIAKHCRQLLWLSALIAMVLPVGAAHATAVSLSGRAIQGPMVGSTVTAYAVDVTTGANTWMLGKTTTDTSGNFTLTIPAHGRPVCLVVKGGSFVSEADGGTVTAPSRLNVLLPGASTDISGISINPLTRFIRALTMGKLHAGNVTLREALSSATVTIESYYGLSTDPARLLPDYTAAGVGTDAGKLGLILGALINEDQHLCPNAPGGLVAALAADMVNGVFNGKYGGLPIPYCGHNLQAIAGTSDFQDALAGVQQLQYVSAGFAFGGLYGPAGNILMSQNPVVTPDMLLASVATISAAITRAAPSSSSTLSPPMKVAHASATATLLRSGKVLIAGGNTTATATRSTELYNPATDTFSAGPRMVHARYGATATLLPNGEILIAGGNDGSSVSNALNSTEFYNPATKTFAPGPSMITARFGAGAALLPNGKVLIAGGLDGSTPGGLSSTEIYDPATNSFSAGPSMNEPPGSCTAILLPNGKVFINGSGLISNGPASNDVSVAELYDPSNNSITEISLNTVRQFAANVLLPNGKVLLAGGAGLGGVLTSTQIYDPSQDTFVDGPSMGTGHWFATAAQTANGKVLIIGGNGNGPNAIDNVDVYDSVSNSFTAGTSMSDPRLFSTATLLPNGRVLIAGGWNGTNSLTSTELYLP
jgi:Kelch motif